MRYRPLGASGIEASVVGLGTWAVGGWMWGGVERSEAVRAIRAALDTGITLVDTAPVYGFGLSEELVGEAIAGRRDEVVLATKCGLSWWAEKGDFHFYSDGKGISRTPTSTKVYKCLDPDSIRYEIEQSLRRLRTDRIDLYQTHWQDSTTPIQETMACLLRLKEEGKVRAIGASNATVEQLGAYLAAGQLDADQEKYSCLDRQMENGQLQFCREHGVAVLAYSPLALGLLTGAISPDRQFGEGDLRRNNPRFSVEGLRKVAAMLEEFLPVAQRHGLTLAQLAIAWTVAQPGLTHALVGARTPRHALENARAGDAALSEEDLRTLDSAIARHTQAEMDA